MKIAKVRVQNFRLLQDVTIQLHDQTTLVVGRNNSGKTSLTEVFCKFLENKGSHFKFEDISIGSHPKYLEAYDLYQIYVSSKQNQEVEEEQIRKEAEYKAALPGIRLDLHIEYQEEDDLTALSTFIMDLDPDRRDALIRFQYGVKEPEKLFTTFDKQKTNFNHSIIGFIKKCYGEFYSTRAWAVDSQNQDYTIEIEKFSDLNAVFLSGFIYAQRQLDDQYADNYKKLSKGFESFYKLNKEIKEADIKRIEESLQMVSINLDEQYESLFKSLFSDLSKFGVEQGINLQKLAIRSVFEADKILKGNTHLFYQHGVSTDHLLPESYNGLGYSNLIYIILQFISFYEEYDKRKPRPAFQVLFVEEPEAHLHPQMQYIFIKNIKEFIHAKTNWHVQVIITTHSSHIIAESGFDNIRYFDNTAHQLVIKNLSEFRIQEDKKDPDGMRFLKQYMALNRCDMFFADKIILIEGTVERLLLPLMINKVQPSLLTKYVSIIEVGGAYAHLFKDLLCFLNVKTLIITDLDSICAANSKACKVSLGHKTSNAVLRSWLPQKELLADLQTCTESDKTQGKIRVAYQVIEDTASECARSFEDAFLVRNAHVLSGSPGGQVIPKLLGQRTEMDIRQHAYEIAQEIDSKTAFAFDVMMLTNWEVPTYIKEGLTWLANE
ncbi:ATP-dependent nuclease [Larkinella humicola]|uniref:AAA family ATPase n=1 Tax=Larkinella humicola TaxID=2607654 RepID=A0A5N1J8Z8_9BACT|nr:ATP-dependent endonuclease [Larkinella humicola]KAA9341161.1 AAA family ATPase [Larkinella humicola]